MVLRKRSTIVIQIFDEQVMEKEFMMTAGTYSSSKLFKLAKALFSNTDILVALRSLKWNGSNKRDKINYNSAQFDWMTEKLLLL